MEEILRHPAVQSGIAPFLVAFVAVAGLHFARLGGLAAVAGFATAAFLTGGFDVTSPNAAGAILRLGLAAATVGLLADFAFRPTRLGQVLLVLAAGAAAVWAFLDVLEHKALLQALLAGGGIAAFVAWLAAAGIAQQEHALRAGAIGLGLGLGGGIASIFAASAKFGAYGFALGAASCAFLLWQAMSNKRVHAGATFTLPVTVTAGLLLAGSMMLARLPWYSLAAFACVPLATLLPLPEKSSVLAQAGVASIYALAVAAGACALAWPS